MKGGAAARTLERAGVASALLSGITLERRAVCQATAGVFASSAVGAQHRSVKSAKALQISAETTATGGVGVLRDCFDELFFPPFIFTF